MPKNIHSPREDLVCGKLDEVFKELSHLGQFKANTDAVVRIVHTLADIKHDCERMEQKLITRKQEAALTASDAPVKLATIQCFHCKYWDGDKAKAAIKAEEDPASMCLFKGWAALGRCKIDYEWADLEMTANAIVELKVPANFSCPYAAV